MAKNFVPKNSRGANSAFINLAFNAMKTGCSFRKALSDFNADKQIATS